MVVTIVILLLSVFFFISGKVRSDIVALCALVALMVLGILEPAEALSGFSNNVIIMMIGLFVVGGAIFQTGLAKMISSKLMKLAGSSET
ncbi:MAG: anion permease, partial [Bacteroidaceae bacterium]|nr:anion permease [Bacteroidaceae bacterium]